MRAVSICIVVVSLAAVAAGQRAVRYFDDATTRLELAYSGPTPVLVDREKARAERSRQVQRFLRGTRYRIVNFESGTVNSRATYRVHFYDYTNNRLLIAETEPGRSGARVWTEPSEPGVSADERIEAIDIARSDPRLNAVYGSDAVRVTDAMPRITQFNGQRLVNVGLNYPDGSREMVGISFRDRAVVRYPGGAPVTSLAAHEGCGIHAAGQPVSFNGEPGQHQLNVTQGGATLWEMTVIRPAASSGNPGERSGIELRDVKYRGKSVFKRAHAPILNVKYAANVCGPYRDWKYEEGMFDAPAAGAADVTPGFRVLAPGQIATTSLESGDDTGNFRGVAIYRQGNETVMVSEMEAGWYRYIMEWRFDDDGTIRPRFGFGATENSCVCFTHYHHVYWRFDLDVVTPLNRIYQREGNRAPQQLISNEAAVFRNVGRRQHRQFLVQNSSGAEGYLLIPNLGDGTWNADGTSFGMGDFWLLRFAGTAGSPDEIDDPNFGLADEMPAQIGAWLTNENTVDQDVVIWYGAHFTHAQDGESLLNLDHRYPDTLAGDHVVGPDLRPVNW